MQIVIESRITYNDGDVQTECVTADCIFGTRGGKWFIRYKEAENSTLIKLGQTYANEPDGPARLGAKYALIKRTSIAAPDEGACAGGETEALSGSIRSEILIEEGAINRTEYDTGYGIMAMLIKGQAVEYDLTEVGGVIELQYEMQIEEIDVRNAMDIKIQIRQKVQAQ